MVAVFGQARSAIGFSGHLNNAVSASTPFAEIGGFRFGMQATPPECLHFANKVTQLEFHKMTAIRTTNMVLVGKRQWFHKRKGSYRRQVFLILGCSSLMYIWEEIIFHPVMAVLVVFPNVKRLWQRYTMKIENRCWSCGGGGGGLILIVVADQNIVLVIMLLVHVFILIISIVQQKEGKANQMQRKKKLNI